MRKDGPHPQEHVEESENCGFRRNDSPAVWVSVSLHVAGPLLWQHRQNETCGWSLWRAQCYLAGR